MQIQNTSQLAINPFPKIIIYGLAGSGKTKIIETAPAPFILSAEAGLIGLRRMSIPYYTIHSFDELLEAYKWVIGSNEARQYWTICLDSISEIAEILLASEKPKHKDPRKAYGEVQDRIVQAVRAFRDIPNKFVYFSAKQSTTIDQATGGRIAFPMFPGQQLPQQIPYLFDELYHIENYPTTDAQGNQTTSYVLRTRRDNLIEAKSRVDCLDNWEPANLTQLFEKIRRG